MRQEQALVPGRHGWMAGEQLPTPAPQPCYHQDGARARPAGGHPSRAALPAVTLT